MTRKWVDCRDLPDDTGCALYLSGEENHVVDAAAERAMPFHGAEDTPKLRQMPSQQPARRSRIDGSRLGTCLMRQSTMKRLAISVAIIGGVVVAARVLAPKLHARMLVACKGMFEHMPEDFPPKRMLGGIEEVRANTTRILELLEERAQAERAKPLGEAFPTRADEVEMVPA